MSWQVTQTVRQHRHLLKETKLYNLALYLAEKANERGEVDPAPNHQALAAEFGVSTRTIQNWLTSLVLRGMLEQTRVGSGPGRSSAYQFLLPLAKVEEKVETKVEKVEIFSTFHPTKDEKDEIFSTFPMLKDENFSTFQRQMVEIFSTLLRPLEEKVEMLAQKVEKVERKGDIFSTFTADSFSTFPAPEGGKVEAKDENFSTFSTFQNELMLLINQATHHLESQLNALSQKVENLAAKGGKGRKGGNSPQVLERESKDLNNLNILNTSLSTPQAPHSPPAGEKGGKARNGSNLRLQDVADDTPEARLIQELCDFWGNYLGIAKPRLGQNHEINQALYDDYYIPAKNLLERLKALDPQPQSLLAHAQDLLVNKRDELRKAKGFKVRRLSVLVPDVLDDLNDQQAAAAAKKASPANHYADLYTQY